MNIELSYPWTVEEYKAALDSAEKGDPKPLRLLCRNEVAHFEEVIREHPDYRDGLVQIERLVVEGYLYQKLRGRL